MTETKAKSGAAGTPTNPVEQEAADSGAPATGRAAVGRATVPGDFPSPKFTRAPGMPPPPGPDGDSAAGAPGRGPAATGTAPVVTSAPPMVTSAPPAPASGPPGPPSPRPPAGRAGPG